VLPDLPATGFSNHTDNSVHSIRQGSLRYQSPEWLILEIPSLSTSTQLVSVPLDENNEWPVEWLDERAGILQGSELPGKGTSIIAAHNHLDQTITGPFANIHQLAAGDRIFVTDRFGNMLRFKVYENELVKPDSIKALYQTAIPGSLILVTCENEQQEGGYADRRIVYAEPMQ
jgi:LPXTG-site transpeptidase (sortase) family protein